jgi:gliding motility-associated-like protein
MSVKGFSAVFVVTSNADSGPGTLRDALTQANNNPGKNYISFNLPGATLADHTITLLSYLPIITTSIVIDGTTQPGNPFGISDTKIRVVDNFTYPPGGLGGVFKARTCSDFEIYGIWITTVNNLGYQACVYTSHCDTVQFGAALKGNLIESTGPTLDTGKVCYFQHNICFSDTTGELPGAGDMKINNYEKLVVGGSPATGNMIAAAFDIYTSDPAGFALEVSYNKMGTNFYGTAAPYGFSVMATRLNIIGGSDNSNGQLVDVPINGIIKNNIIADVYDDILLSVTGFTGKVVVQGNGFNTDTNGNYNFNTYSQGGTFAAIEIAGLQTMIIGGDDPSEKNFIAYCSEGVEYDQYQGNSKILVTKNSIYCYGDSAVSPSQSNPPFVKINTVGAGIIKGTSSPNSNIELFEADCSCTTPGPKDYFASVTADSQGKWSYNGVFSGYVMASATLDSLTGVFRGADLDESSLVIKSYSCNSNGAITGIVNPYTTASVSWYNSANQLVGNSIDLKNVPAGTYQLKIDYGGSCEITKTYTIPDYSITVDTSNIKIINPSCNVSGSITGINISSASSGYVYQWVDQGGKTQCNCIDFTGVTPGSYTFKIGNADGTCLQSFGPFVLKNTTGPNIDQAHAKIQSTNCGQSTGAITNLGITGTAPITYAWFNSQQQQVSADSILTGVPADTYKLQVTDNTQCGPVYTSDITIPEINGITINESKAQTTPASCGITDGAITGITVQGATQYNWTDANGKSVGTSVNLTNVPTGSYLLTASNATCSKTSDAYAVLQQAATQFPAYNAVITTACYQQSNGAITVTFDGLVKSARWVNSQGTTIPGGSTITGIGAGTYQLYLTDQNGCETLYKSYTVNEYAQLTATPGIVTDDQCGLNTGAVTATTISGGMPPYIYQWYDDNGKQIGSTNAIANLAAGTYTLDTHDSGCTLIGSFYTVNEQTAIITAPSVSNVQLCSTGSALITVNNASANADYKLYDTENSIDPLDEQKGGRFTVNVTANRSYYISQVSGTCESSRAQLNVTVGLSANIANTFTPNGDGINDYWQIDGIENYPDATVQVFTRYGQKIFDSKGYSTPFDGTYKGQKLPVGTYYYIINLSSKCSLLSGSLTIIR